MFYRVIVSVFLVFFMTTTMAAKEANKDTKTLTQTVFELERSLAILQLSTASLGDYQSLDKKIAQVTSLENRVNFLGNLTFLLCMALAVFFFQLRKQNKRLLELEKSKGNTDE